MLNCHFHELRDAFLNHRIVYEGDKNNSSAISYLTDGVMDSFASAMCFNMGDGDGLVWMQSILELIVLPYEKCWFEYETRIKATSEVCTIGIVARQYGDGINLQIFLRVDRGHVWAFIARCKIDKDGLIEDRCTVEIMPGAPDRLADICKKTLRVFAAFLSALNCSNVIRVEHKPDEKLQRARLRRGKRPLFRFWTLQLELGPRVESAGSGMGTHASPALHLRRGHARQYSPGLYTWVQPCIVGNKKDGLVHKDYAVH